MYTTVSNSAPRDILQKANVRITRMIAYESAISQLSQELKGIALSNPELAAYAAMLLKDMANAIAQQGNTVRQAIESLG